MITYLCVYRATKNYHGEMALVSVHSFSDENGFDSMAIAIDKILSSQYGNHPSCRWVNGQFQRFPDHFSEDFQAVILGGDSIPVLTFDYKMEFYCTLDGLVGSIY
jgi:hypothetical protein